MARLFTVLIGLTLVPALARSDTAAPKKPLTAEALWQLTRLGPPSLSPDGKWAVLAATTYEIKTDKPTSALWLIPTAGGEGRQLTAGIGSDSNPTFSPDGKSIAFLSKRGEDETSQLYVIPVDGGEAKRLTSVPGGAYAPKWFPDSKRIAFASWVFPAWKGWEDQAKQSKDRKDSKMTARVWDKPPGRHWDRLLDLVGFRRRLRGQHRPGLGDQTLPGHDCCGRVAGAPALDRQNPDGGGRRKLWGISRELAARKSPPVQDTGGARWSF